MSEPITQAQDHEGRIGRLEGIAELLIEQGRQTHTRLDRIESRIDSLTRWLIGIQLASLLAIGSLLFRILDKLP